MRLRVDETPGGTTLALQASSDDVARLVVATSSVSALVLLGTALATVPLPEGALGSAGRYLVGQLDLRTERNLAVWYASLLLLAAAASFVVAFAAERAAGPRSDPLARGWLVVAAGFAALSLDEAGGLHEAIGQVEPLNPFPRALDTWIGVFALPIVAAGSGLALFAWLRLRKAPGALVLFRLGLVLFLTVPVQEWLEARMRRATAGAARPVAYALLEEGTELFGSLCFLAAGLVYATLRAGGALDLRWALPARAVRAGTLMLVGVLLAGLLVVDLLLPALGLGPYRGVPAGWFASVAALGGAVAGAAAWQAGGGARALLLVAASVATAADLGSGQALSGQLFEGSPRREAALRLSLAVATGVAALLARPALAGAAARWGAGVWGLLAAAALLAGGRVQNWLAFSAYAALLVAVAIGRGRLTPVRGDR